MLGSETKAAIAQAAAVFPSWAGQTAKERARIMKRCDTTGLTPKNPELRVESCRACSHDVEAQYTRPCLGPSRGRWMMSQMRARML